MNVIGVVIFLIRVVIFPLLIHGDSSEYMIM
jgi:hypothetical protein